MLKLNRYHFFLIFLLVVAAFGAALLFMGCGGGAGGGAPAVTTTTTAATTSTSGGTTTSTSGGTTTSTSSSTTTSTSTSTTTSSTTTTTVPWTSKSWQGVEGPIESGASGMYSAFQFGIDNSGDDLLVYQNRTSNLWVSRSRILLGLWQDEILLGTNYPGKFAMNGQGKAIYVYNSTYSSSYTDPINLINYQVGESAWSSPEVVVNGKVGAAGIDDNGNQIVIYETSREGSYWDLKAIRYLSGSWQAPETIATSSVSINYLSPMKLFVSRSGKAAVIWGANSGEDGAFASVSEGSGWSSPVSLSADVYTFGIDIAIDDSGKAIAIWAVEDPTNNAYVRTYNGAAWSVPEIISKYSCELVMSSANDAMVIYTSRETTSSPRACYARKYNGTSWEATEKISTDSTSTFEVGDFSLATDSNGNYLAVWTRYLTDYPYPYGSQKVILSRLYQAGTGWGNIETAAASVESLYEMSVKMNSSGYAIAQWTTFAPSNWHLNVNRYQ